MFVNKSTYLKLKVAYNNIHKKVLGYNRWDSASCTFVNNIIVNFDAILSKNIDGFRKRVYHIENNLIKCTNTYIIIKKNILNGSTWSMWVHVVILYPIYIFFIIY